MLKRGVSGFSFFDNSDPVQNSVKVVSVDANEQNLNGVLYC